MKIIKGQIYKHRYVKPNESCYFKITGIGPRTVYIVDISSKVRHRFSKSSFITDFKLSEVHSSPLWKVLNG